MKELAKKYVGIAMKPLFTILLALAIGAVLILAANASPWEAYKVLFAGAFGSVNGILGTLAKATPLMFTGLAAAFAMNSGVFNIGVEGQLYLGALASAVVGVTCGGLPSFLLIPLCLVAAMAAAVLWAVLPGFLNAKLGVNIFILFFMTNNMAMLFTEYLANGPFKGNLPTAATDRVAEGARLMRFSSFADLNMGFVIAIVIAVLVYFVMYKTVFGYENAALGQNLKFSEYIGIHLNSRTLLVLFISAMIAGLAGAEQVLGVTGRFYANFSANLGFTGISVALLAKNHPLGVFLFAVFFGALNNGAQLMQAATSVPADLTNALQAIMILLVSADLAAQFWKGRHNKKKEVTSP